MKGKIALASALVATTLAANAAWAPAEKWPVLKHYDKDHLYRVALPLGGIGTGSFSLGGRGELVDWVMMNATRREYIPAGYDNDYLTPFFAITLKGAKTPRLGKTLQGPTYPWERQHFTGKGTPNCGFAHFTTASFDGGFPFGTVNLEDRTLPVKVAVRGFSPFIPGDEAASGIPFGSLAYEVTNTSDEPLEVSVAGTIPNLVGLNGSHDAKGRKPRNEFREGDGFRGIWYTASGIDAAHEAAGTMAFVTEEKDGVSARLAIRPGNWSQTVHATQEWWRDFTDNGELNAVQNGKPVASLAVKKTVAPGAKAVFAFHLFWHFPNRYGWGRKPCGNWYATQYADAWDVAAKTLPQLPRLEARSLAFARAYAACDYPAAMKERAAMNLSVYKGAGEFRDREGRFMGFEGVGNTFGCSSGSTTHVFNYEQATGYLFPRLAQTKRDVEFNLMMHADGSIPCHQTLPLEPGKSGAACGHKVVDGHCGVMMKLYRDGLFSGDRAWFARYLPLMKKAADFLWAPTGFDQNKDGLVDMLDGQFNTYDICFRGPNPLAQFWYLGALRAAEEFAMVAGDAAFADECRRVFDSGRRLADERLFNGEYYIQLLDDPEVGQQMGNGCLSDQLLGQQTAHLLGLGYLAKPENVRRAAAAIAKYNFRKALSDHCNYYRTYAMDEEAGLLLMTYPKADEVRYPFTYWSEVWTGIEYTTASELLCEGLEKEALAILDGVCGRYNGLNRNPYSEIEWGHNYVRSLASWNVLMAWSGLRWNGITGTLDFGSRTGRFFWALNGAWGTATVTPEKVTLEVAEGDLDVRQVRKDGKSVAWSKVKGGRLELVNRADGWVCEEAYWHVIALGSRGTPRPLKGPAMRDIRLGGRVGEMLDRHIQNGMAKKDADAYAAVFDRSRLGKKGAWAGEYWGKWLMAAAPVQAYSGNAELKAKIDRTVNYVLANQYADGYIGDIPVDKRPPSWDIWCRKYTSLGLLAYYRETGDARALEAVCRLCDHLMTTVGPGKSDISLTGWHHGFASMGILQVFSRLATLTGEAKYRDYAAWIADQMERGPKAAQLVSNALAGKDVGFYTQYAYSHAWSNSSKSYEMTTCYIGLLDWFRAGGGANFLNAARAAADSIARTEITIIGAGNTQEQWFGGASRQTLPIMHPNEGCTKAVWMHLCRELLETTGETRWADEFEKTLFNAFLSGWSPDGSRFQMYQASFGRRGDGPQRNQCGLATHCCNEIGPYGFVDILNSTVMTDGRDAYVAQYVPGRVTLTLEGAGRVEIVQETDYPASGKVRITVNPEKTARFALKVRVPGWLTDTLPDWKVYAREWTRGDKVELDWPISVRTHRQDGHIAFTAGPVVLARDTRYGDGDVDEPIEMIGGKEPTRFVPDTRPHPGRWISYEAKMAPWDGSVGYENVPQTRQIRFCDFASAANTWDDSSRCRVWCPEIQYRPKNQ